VVVEVHQFGEIADESAFITLPVGWPETARRLVVDCSVALKQTGVVGRRHVLEGQLDFEFTDNGDRDSGYPTDTRS
jgi:hypothetical protein